MCSSLNAYLTEIKENIEPLEGFNKERINMNSNLFKKSKHNNGATKTQISKRLITSSENSYYIERE